MWRSSGIGRYLRDLLPSLIKYTNYQWIALIDNSYDGSIDGVKLVSVKSKVYSIREQLELLQVTPKCDLFWSPHYNIPIFLPQVKRQLCTVHDVNHLHFSRSLSLAKRIYSRLMFLIIRLKVEYVLTVSQFSKREIEKHVGLKAERIQVIYNMLNLINFKEVKNHTFKRPFFLVVGNLKPHKNSLLAIKGFLKSEASKDYDLRIIGAEEETEYCNNIRKLSKVNENVILEGKVDDNYLWDCYQSASALLFLSEYEGFGYPVIEAFNFNTPVIASNFGAVHEISNGAALEVDLGKLNDISLAIDRIADGSWVPEEGVVRKSLERFNADKIVKEYIDLFTQILGDD